MRVAMAMVEAARRPKEMRRVIDGTHHLFIREDPDADTVAGWTWSPPPSTAAAGLAQVVERRRDYAEAPTDSRASLEPGLRASAAAAIQAAEALSPEGAPSGLEDCR